MRTSSLNIGLWISSCALLWATTCLSSDLPAGGFFLKTDDGVAWIEPTCTTKTASPNLAYATEIDCLWREVVVKKQGWLTCSIYSEGRSAWTTFTSTDGRIWVNQQAGSLCKHILSFMSFEKTDSKWAFNRGATKIGAAEKGLESCENDLGTKVYKQENRMLSPTSQLGCLFLFFGVDFKYRL